MKPLVMKSRSTNPGFDANDYMTAPEAAQYLRISKAHLGNLVRGKVPGVAQLQCCWIGRRMIFKRSWLDEFIEATSKGGLTHVTI